MSYKVAYNARYGGYSLTYGIIKYMYEHGIEEPYRTELKKALDGLSEYAASRGKYVLYYVNNEEHGIYAGCYKTLADAERDAKQYISCSKFHNRQYIAASIDHVPLEVLDTYYDIALYGVGDDIPRYHKLLIEAIKTIYLDNGIDAYSGLMMTLDIAYIDSNVYTISEYDGKEYIKEYWAPEDIQVIPEDYEQ